VVGRLTVLVVAPGRYARSVTRDGTQRIAPERSVRGDIDPKLIAISAQITSMPIDARLRQIEAEANFFAGVRPLDGA